MDQAENNQAPLTPARTALVAAVLGLALLGSGFAGLTNEVVWQRSLKRLLGGSETISATIVVLVFMFGLGTGAIAMGNRARKAKDPLLWLAGLEGALCVANLAVCALLQLDLTSTVFGIQAAVDAAGIPLGLMYAVGSLVVLAVPTLLMGATTPMASEVCQRRLGQTDARVLGLIFFVNTLGAMVGCVLGSTTFVPIFGLTQAMMLAAACNLAAGLVLLLLRTGLPTSPAAAAPAADQAAAKRPIWKGTTEEIVAMGLGAVALSYELVLLRANVLVHEPQPATFSMVLAGFLLFWSVGAGLGSRNIPLGLRSGLIITPLLGIAGVWSVMRTEYVSFDSAAVMLEHILTHPLQFLPCLLFGFLFTRITARAAQDWGRDVGRIYGWNTVGACLGILGTTFIAYELHLWLATALVVVVGLLVAGFFADRTAAHTGLRWTWLPLAGLVVIAIIPSVTDTGRWNLTERIAADEDETRFFFGSSGVVGVDKYGNVFWDGLWHSAISKEPGDLVDTENWWMAVAPIFAHPTGKVKKIAIVGMGTGITAATMAKADHVEHIDAYEINHTLKEVFREYPEGTMGAATNPKISLHWQDARTGLNLRDEKYDVITTAPLYLRQAGAGLLNSVENMRAIRSRLKPDGVVCMFSWGTDAQALTVRQTAATVFPYQMTINGGYLLLLSNQPLDLSEATLARRLAEHAGDPLWDELMDYTGGDGAAGLVERVDDPQFYFGDGRLITTDDRPIIEYPGFLERAVDELNYDPNLRLHLPSLR
jgi:predicted membrane-bound spermidine synthase